MIQDSVPAHDLRQQSPYFKVGHRQGLDPAVRQQASLVHAMHGRASVDINLKGFPRGTKTAAKTEGIFREVRLNRSRAYDVST
jgi:N-formylglutamate amidohydrolase